MRSMAEYEGSGRRAGQSLGDCFGLDLETETTIHLRQIICILQGVPASRQHEQGLSGGRNRLNLHDQVAARLGVRIVGGTLKQGQVLPREELLAAEHGVSRTALREAIKVLASKSLVEVRRKTGTRVRPRTEWNVLDPDVLGWLFSGRGIPAGLEDLLEVRRLIEPAAARMAAERADDKDQQSIASALLAMMSAKGDVDLAVEADLAFHLAILEAAHNAFMRPFGALIQAALRISFRFTSSRPEPYLRTLDLHQAVVTAIANRKADKAEKAMTEVLAQTSRDIAEQMASDKQKPSRVDRASTLNRKRQ